MKSNKRPGNYALSRRGFLKTLGCSVIGVSAAGLIGYTYVFHVEPEWYAIERIDIPIPNLPPAFNNFRIACLSDIHFEPYTHLDYIQRVVNLVNELEPDLICLLGDYVFAHAGSIMELGPVLGDLHARHGVFAILGNHDLWTDSDVIRSGLESHGIRVLVNQSVTLGSDGDSLILAGLDDGWSGKPDIAETLAEIPETAPVILLLHEPDFADRMASDERVKLQLSGHSHGGQVRLPLLGAPFLPDYSHKYDQGLYRVEEMWLYVTRGIGVIYPPGRFNCRPELTEITLIDSAQ